MAAKLPVWGVDLGQSAVKAVKLQAAGEQFELLEVAAVEHAQLLSQPQADPASLVRASLETLLSRHDLRKEPVVVTVPGQQTLTRFAKLPPVEQKKIPDIVNFEAQQQIPFDMDEVVWDYEIFSPKDSPDVEVGIFAIRKELIRNHLAHFTQLGIEPIAVQSTPLAAYNALVADGQIDSSTTLILDIGAMSTDLIVVEGRSIWSRPVPIGGNAFTEALVKSFRLNFQKAEALKRGVSSSKYARQVFQAMRPVFSDFVSEIQRSIGFYTSTHRQSQIGRVLGLGRALSLPGLTKFLQQNLQLPVERFSGFKRAVPTPVLQSPAYTEHAVSLAVAFGAALQGLGGATVQSSLLPSEFVRQQLWRKKRLFFSASAACLVGAAGAIWLGNFLAGSALAAKSGGVKSANFPMATNAEAAERVLTSPRSADAPPLNYAVTVGGALEKLRAEYAAVPGLDALQAQFRTMSALPKSNLVVPQMIDVIHRAFADAVPEDVRKVQSVEDYVALSKRMNRSDRNEMWIDQIRCRFDNQDATKAFAARMQRDSAEGEEGSAGAGSKAGWAVLLYGRTTAANPANLLEKVATRMRELGRQPDRGFWVQDVELRSVDVATEGAPARAIPPPQGGAVAPPGGRSGRGGIVPGASRDDRTGRGSSGARSTGRAGTGIAVGGVESLQVKPGIDPVTNESTAADSSFFITVVIRLGPVPPNVLKAGAKGPPGKSAPQAPPARPAARD